MKTKLIPAKYAPKQCFYKELDIDLQKHSTFQVTASLLRELTDGLIKDIASKNSFLILVLPPENSSNGKTKHLTYYVKRFFDYIPQKTVCVCCEQEILR